MGTKKRKSGTVRLIGVFRLIKALLLIAIGCGAPKFLHQDVGNQIRSWLQHWQVDPDGRYLRALVSKTTHIDDKKLELISAATFFYAGLFLVEGVGLLMLKRWAEIFTVIVTASFIPLEIYHLVRHFSALKIVAIAVNVAILVYLIWRLKHERNTGKS